MQINNINTKKIDFKSEQTKQIIPQKEIEIPSKTIELPDIRANQILLPDNKIYLPKGIKPVDFNKEGISVVKPSNYKILREPSEEFDKVAAKFKKSHVSRYLNTKTGEEVVRVTKNDFAENNVLNSISVMEFPLQNQSFGVKYIQDYEHNTETEIQYLNPTQRPIIKSKTTIYKDENGKVVKSEKYEKSPYLKGVFDITETDADGNETIISKTTKATDGTITLERNLVSLDGTTTKYIYETDEKGQHKRMYCQIADKDGKVLSTIDRSYDKVNDSEILSSVNGNEFKIEKNDDGIKVTDYTKGNSTQINSHDFDTTEETKMMISLMSGKPRSFSEESVIEELFDTLPADTLLTLHENIREILPLKDDLDSAFVGAFDYLMCKTDNFVINHELGHSKDAIRASKDGNLLNSKIKDVIAGQKDFRETYIEEKAAFVKAFPEFEEKFIDYFINSPKSKPQRGRKETVAESNAINGLEPQEPEMLAMRTIVLQRYFPRTIAILTNVMNRVATEDAIVNQGIIK